MLTSYSESPKALTISVSGDVVGGRAWGAVERADVIQPDSIEWILPLVSDCNEALKSYLYLGEYYSLSLKSLLLIPYYYYYYFFLFTPKAISVSVSDDLLSVVLGGDCNSNYN
jgi:hypothetical protein